MPKEETTLLKPILLLDSAQLKDSTHLHSLRATSMGFLVLLLLSVWSVSEVKGQPQTVVASTPNGNVRGLCRSGYCVFKGVPYAQNVTTTGRWAAPKPVIPWSPNTLSALKYGPVCPQPLPLPKPVPSRLPMSEDCLSLNIWSPSSVFIKNGKQHELDATLPIIVFIHGGSFIDGTGSDPLLEGVFFANSSDVVMVTIQYRLGALGWLSAASLELDGNFGLMDQQLALRFVQENIASFGGDPTRVTIAGQSAGAMSVLAHTCLSSSAPLFNATIQESNPAGVLYRTPSENNAVALTFATKLDCLDAATNAANLTCLQSLPYTDIVNAQDNVVSLALPLNSSDFLQWGPTVDGQFLTGQPFHMFFAGECKQVPSLLGTVRNESDSFVPNVTISPTAYEKFVAAVFEDAAPAVLGLYPSMSPDSFDELNVLGTDYIWNCPTRVLAMSSAQAGMPCFLYEFNHTPSDDPTSTKPECTDVPCHTSDLPFWFHSQELANATWTEAESELSTAMITSWIEFAVAPDSPGGVALPTITWPPYDMASNVSLDLDLTISLTSNFRQLYCDFWDTLGYWY